MPDNEHDEYRGVGGSYVLDPDTGKRRPAQIPPTPLCEKGGSAAEGDFKKGMERGASTPDTAPAAPGPTVKPNKLARK